VGGQPQELYDVDSCQNSSTIPHKTNMTLNRNGHMVLREPLATASRTDKKSTNLPHVVHWYIEHSVGAEMCNCEADKTNYKI